VNALKVIYLDCFAGISGNMLLGAFLQGGVPEAYLRRELSKLHLDGEFCLRINKVNKNGIEAIYADVQVPHVQEDSHGKDRDLLDIRRILEASSLSDKVKSLGLGIFNRLADAEGKVHGMAPEKVHFHEVGAVDSIVDIVSAAICLDYLQIEKIYTSRLCVGSGFVECRHGKMPVPTPATVELLQDVPFYAGDIQRELVTPTGAAFVATLAEKGIAEMPENFHYTKVAYGAGTWDLDIPNVLRLYIGEMDQAEQRSKKLLVETNIDDLSPQVYEYVCEELSSIGAIDVWITPIIMKKMRPAQKLSLLTDESRFQDCVALIFRETTTVGLRVTEVGRIAADRTMKLVPTPYGGVHCKVSRYEGKNIYVSVDYEDCKALAKQFKIPLKRIQREALQIANSLYVDGTR